LITILDFPNIFKFETFSTILTRVTHYESGEGGIFSAIQERLSSGEDEQHPLVSLMELSGTLIEKYEEEHGPELGEHIVVL